MTDTLDDLPIIGGFVNAKWDHGYWGRCPDGCLGGNHADHRRPADYTGPTFTWLTPTTRSRP